MYFRDLTPYSYIGRKERVSELNVGWLEKSYPHEMGHVEDDIVQKILILCFRPVHTTRGFHYCDLCTGSRTRVRVKCGDLERALGSAEIRVPGEEGVVYAAPNLVYHYITKHGYRPPVQFLDAVHKLVL